MKQFKRLVVCLLLSILILGACLPSQVHAAANVKIVYGGKTLTYSKKKTAIYINSKKISLSKKPIFLKAGSYMGPAKEIFANSSLKVAYNERTDHGILVLTYNGHVLRMVNGSKKVTIDGKEDEFGTAPLYAKYKSSKQSAWIVPIKSVCTRLGITYKFPSSGKITLTGATNNGATTTEPAPTTQSNNGKFVVVLDAGHGGSDSGAKGNNLAEKNLNLAIVLAAKQYFDKDSRFQVYYTRTSDVYPSLDDRCTFANNLKADVFLCVHINSYKSTSQGTETLYNYGRNTATANGNITSRDLAWNMQYAIQAATGFLNRGLVDRRDLRVLNNTNMPACLMEFGFISNKTEAISMNANTGRYGQAIYNGLVAYLKAKERIK